MKGLSPDQTRRIDGSWTHLTLSNGTWPLEILNLFKVVSVRVEESALRESCPLNAERRQCQCLTSCADDVRYLLLKGRVLWWQFRQFLFRNRNKNENKQHIRAGKNRPRTQPKPEQLTRPKLLLRDRRGLATRSHMRFFMRFQWDFDAIVRTKPAPVYSAR